MKGQTKDDLIASFEFLGLHGWKFLLVDIGPIGTLQIRHRHTLFSYITPSSTKNERETDSQESVATGDGGDRDDEIRWRFPTDFEDALPQGVLGDLRCSAAADVLSGAVA